MQDEWWEKPVCYLCDYWWVLLILLVLTLTGWFTRDLWMPAAPAPTAMPTFTPTLMPTLAPTATPSATRVATLGTGDVQVTLFWNSTNDLDLWVSDPNGEVIYYSHSPSMSGGTLDVDANKDCSNMTNQPVENIFWPTGQAPRGEYVISVNYYKQCETAVSSPFTIRVLVDGQVQEFTGVVNAQDETVEVYRFVR
jgi:hypothetical protein